MGQIVPREEKICPGEVIADGQTNGKTDEQTGKLITIGGPQIRTLINRFYNILLKYFLHFHVFVILVDCVYFFQH